MPAIVNRRQLATEVLEMGETLFDAVLDAAAQRPLSVADERFPEQELRTAACEFFEAVRLLLQLQDEGGSRSSATVPPTPRQD